MTDTLQTTDIASDEGHDLLKMLVVPRPVAWVTTLRDDGIVNLAPFATYTILGFGPMMVGLGFARVGGVHKKETLRNIERSREFVVHPVTEDVLARAVRTARTAPAGESKVLTEGLTLAASTQVAVPRIVECAAALECRCEDVIRIGNGHDLVVGRVLAVYRDPRCFPNGEPDFRQFRPVSRLHDEYFGTLGEVIYLPRQAAGDAPHAR